MMLIQIYIHLFVRNEPKIALVFNLYSRHWSLAYSLAKNNCTVIYNSVRFNCIRLYTEFLKAIRLHLNRIDAQNEWIFSL